jgi:hypothetical protein
MRTLFHSCRVELGLRSEVLYVSIQPRRDRWIRTKRSQSRQSAEDGLKPFLDEVVVVGQDFLDSVAPHGRHRDAVDQTVTLVIAFLVQTQARQKRRARLRMNRRAAVSERTT